MNELEKPEKITSCLMFLKSALFSWLSVKNLRSERFSHLLSIGSKLRLLWFCIASLRDWPANLAPLFQPMGSKSNTNHDLYHSWLVFWLAHCTVCICCDWWLVSVIAIVLVLRHSIENRSKPQSWICLALYCWLWTADHHDKQLVRFIYQLMVWPATPGKQ